jgi:hypothetical protein
MIPHVALASRSSTRPWGPAGHLTGGSPTSNSYRKSAQGQYYQRKLDLEPPLTVSLFGDLLRRLGLAGPFDAARFAHRAFCAMLILRRPAADMVRLLGPPPYTLANAVIAAFSPDNCRSTRSRSLFNCFTIADKFTIEPPRPPYCSKICCLRRVSVPDDRQTYQFADLTNTPGRPCLYVVLGKISDRVISKRRVRNNLG